MSAESVLRAALLAALRGDATLSEANGVIDGTAVKATPPFVELGPLLAADWGFKDRAGRELRSAVSVRDRRDVPHRAQALAAAVDAAVSAVPRDLDGWRVASVAFVRSRIAAVAPGDWRAVVEHRFRMMAE